jgi:hypothetical protein
MASSRAVVVSARRSVSQRACESIGVKCSGWGG